MKIPIENSFRRIYKGVRHDLDLKIFDKTINAFGIFSLVSFSKPHFLRNYFCKHVDNSHLDDLFVCTINPSEKLKHHNENENA